MIRLGYFSSNLHPKFVQFNVIKQDVADYTNLDFKVHKQGTRSHQAVNRIKTSVEFDFVTPTILASLRNCMLESWLYPKIFMKHPSPDSQIRDFNGITNPGISKVLFLKSDNPNAVIGSAAEINNTDYAKIYDIDNNHLYSDPNTDHNYSYYFFKFYIDSEIIDLYNTPFQRVSLMLHNPTSTDNSINEGFKVDAYNQEIGQWVEFSRVNYATVFPSNDKKVLQHFSVIRPLEIGSSAFTKLSDFASDSNFYFRMRNIRRFATSGVIGFNYAVLLLDGWPVSIVNDWNFSFRSNYTPDGYTGKLELQEL